MIKLVLPVCEAQSKLVGGLVNRFRRFADMKDRDILVTYTWADHFNIPELVGFLKPLFNSVQQAQLPDVPEAAEWPEIGNWMFYQSAIALWKTGNKDPWYWFEADNWPLYAGWLDDFDVDYLGGGKPYMGAVNTTHLVNRHTGVKSTDGTHMVGTGVYPADFLGRSQEVHELVSQPWDVACQAEIMPECHETQLIFHAWQTGHYKVVDGEVIGQDLGPHKGRYGGRPIPPAARVVHGCKDGSLAQIDFEVLRAMV